jgi:hypothetical protein
MIQASIFSELVLRISTFSQVLHRAAAFTAEVDCLVALAIVARERDYVRPVLTHENILHIKNGRISLYLFLGSGEQMFVILLVLRDFSQNNDSTHDVVFHRQWFPLPQHVWHFHVIYILERVRSSPAGRAYSSPVCTK